MHCFLLNSCAYWKDKLLYIPYFTCVLNFPIRTFCILNIFNRNKKKIHVRWFSFILVSYSFHIEILKSAMCVSRKFTRILISTSFNIIKVFRFQRQTFLIFFTFYCSQDFPEMAWQSFRNNRKYQYLEAVFFSF